MSSLRSIAFGLFALHLFVACAGADPRPRGTASAPSPQPSPSAAPGDGVPSDEEISALVESFEVALARDGGDPQGQTTRALADAQMSHINAACLRGARSSLVQSTLVSLLAKLQDARAQPCFLHTLEHYRPDHTDDDVAQVLIAVQRMKLTGLRPQVMALFAKVRVHRAGAVELGRILPDVVIALATRDDEPQLIAVLATPMPTTDDPAYADEYFWQTVATRALGQLRTAQAVQPLIAILLDVDRSAIAPLASAALVSIGRPAIEPLSRLLGATDKELRELGAGTMRVGSVNLQTLAGTVIGLLGEIGVDACAGPLLAARTKLLPVHKVAIARALTQLPRKPSNLKALQDMFDEVDFYYYAERIFGKLQIADAAAGFQDAKLTPWLVKSGLLLKDEYSRAQSVKGAALLSAIKLMTKEQVPDVRRLLKARTTDGTVGDGYEEQWKIASEMVALCDARTACYLEALSEPMAPNRNAAFRYLKAATMLGALGDEKTRDDLVRALPSLAPAAQGHAVAALLALSPRGGEAAAAAVQPIDAKAAAKLRARVEPVAP